MDYALLDAVPMGIFIINEQHTVLFWNSIMEYWTGLSRETVVGRQLSQYFPHLMQPRYVNRLSGIFTGGPPTTFSPQLHRYIIPVPRSEGEYQVQQTTVTAIEDTDEDGTSCYHAMFSVQDVTDLHYQIRAYQNELAERKAAEAKLQEAAKRELAIALEREQIELISTFISDATHEFRTPLSVINSSIYLVQRSNDAAKRERYTTLIQEQVTILSELVDGLVLMAGIDRDKSQPSDAIDINHVVTIVCDKLQGHMERKGISLKRDLYPQPLTIIGHGNYLWHALTALMDNALRYTNEGGTVTVRTIQDAQHLRLCVIDNGVGIPEADLPHIFERFYRGDKAHSTPGFGLGLSIVKKVIENHHGQILVESKPGVGSTFTITLPYTS